VSKKSGFCRRAGTKAFGDTAVCKNRRYSLRIRKITLFAIASFLELGTSYSLTTTHLTYNPFLHIKSAVLDDSFDLLFIPPGLLLKKLLGIL
jgi:hypothetical protein